MGGGLPDLPKRVHLSVEGKAGGTTMALQYARHSILEGGRVIWASESMPDSERFGQLFADVDIVSSSRFHALELGTKLELAISQVVEASKFLPSVNLVVIDDWAPEQGKTPESTIKLAKKVLDVSERGASIILTSKSYDNLAEGETVAVRAQKRLEEFGCATWKLSRRSLDGNLRLLSTPEGDFEFTLEENGFF